MAEFPRASISYHNWGQVLTLKAADGLVQDLYMAAEMRWVMSLFKSMDLPNSCMEERESYLNFTQAHDN